MRLETRNNLIGYSLAFLATLLWGTFYPLSRLVLGEQNPDPLQFSFVRYIIASLFFLPIIFCSSTRRRQLPQILKNDWLTVLFLALTGVVGQGLLIFCANKFTTSSHSGLIANTTPILTVLVACFWLKEKLTIRMAAGMFVGFGGILLLSLTGGADKFEPTFKDMLIGDFMALVSGIFWAFYTVGGTNITRKYDAFLITGLAFIFAVPFVPLVMLIFHSSFEFNFTPEIWGSVCYMGIAPAAVAYCAWYGALKFVDASKLGSFGYLSAIISALCAVLFLGEQMTLILILATACVIAGMALMVGKKH